jgi:hypothetical protein
LFNEAIELAAYKPVRVILLQREQCLASIQQGRDIDWADALGTQRNLPIVVASEGLMLFISYIPLKLQVNLKVLFVIMVGIRFWLGSGAFLYCLWTTVTWMHHNSV